MNPYYVTLGLDIAFWAVLFLVACCLVAVIVGPGNVDRLLATDIALILIAVDLAIFAAARETSWYMDASLVIASLGFLVTAVVARQLELGRGFR